MPPTKSTTPEGLAPGFRFEFVPLTGIAPHPDNENVNDQAAIDASVEAHGFADVVIAQTPRGRRKRGYIIAGHGRWTSAKAAGMESVPVVWLDVDDDEAARLRIHHNATGRAAVWDDPKLAASLQALAETDAGLVGTGFDVGDLDRLLSTLETDANPGDLTGGEPEPLPDLDDDEMQPGGEGDTVTKVGDLWHLGPHRVMCGDTWEADDVAKLLEDAEGRVDAIVTDPPYAIYGSSSGLASDIADDKMVLPFFRQLGQVCAGVVKTFGHVYVCCDWRSYSALWQGLRAAKLAPKNCIVWDKGGAGLGSNYANTHEFVAFFARLPAQNAMGDHVKKGQRNVFRSNVWHGARVSGKEREHNAAKPVELCRFLVENSTDEGETVLDLFAGSGSTLIAAHHAGRVGFAMEKEPGMVDVICRRYQRVTGELPTRDGVPHDFGSSPE